MQRTIVQAADVSGAALDELKAWLGASRSRDDAMLVDLLEASVAVCEAFISQAPLAQTIEEHVPAARGTYTLTSRPIRSILGAQLIAPDGGRSDFSEDNWRSEFEATGKACVTIDSPQNGRSIAFSLQVGIATDWEALPAGLKHGVLRLAAYHYRDRDVEGNRTAPPTPASVMALWRPWRTLRLT